MCLESDITTMRRPFPRNPNLDGHPPDMTNWETGTEHDQIDAIRTKKSKRLFFACLHNIINNTKYNVYVHLAGSCYITQLRIISLIV